MKEHKYKTIFSSTIHPVVNQDKNKYLALASIEQLKGFLPQIDVEKDYDLLGFSANSCNINRANKNHDLIDTQTALAAYKSYIWKGINLEHSRQRYIGCLINAGFSEFGTDKLLKEEEVKDYTKPFNIVVGGVIWKVIGSKLIDFLEETNDPESDNYLAASLSFEVGFSTFDLLAVKGNSRNLEDGRRISDTKEVESLTPFLKASGGTGKLPSGENVYRIAKDVTFLGVGAVLNPAADVKGILFDLTNDVKGLEDKAAILPPNFIEQLKNTKESGMGYHICDIELSNGTVLKDIKVLNCSELPEEVDPKLIKNISIKANKDENSPQIIIDSNIDIPSLLTGDEYVVNKETAKKLGNSINSVIYNIISKELRPDGLITKSLRNKEKISHSQNSVVIKDKVIMSKIKDISEVTDEKLTKGEITAATMREFIEERLKEPMEKIMQEKKAKEGELQAAKTAQEELSKNYENVKTQLETINKNFEKLQAEAAEKEKLDKYNQRMAHIDETYELDVDLRKIVASDLKDLDEEGFKKLEEKYKVLFKDKNKEALAKVKVEKEKLETEAKTKLEAKGSEDTKTIVEDALKNAVKDKTTIANTTSPETPTLLERAKKAFAIGKDGGISIDTSKRRKI